MMTHVFDYFQMGRAYSGGQDTKELQSRFGANIDVIILHHQNNTDAANTNPLVVPYTSNADDMPLVSNMREVLIPLFYCRFSFNH